MEENNPIKYNEKEEKTDSQTEEMKKIREEFNRMNPKLASKEEMEDISRRVGNILEQGKDRYKKRNKNLFMITMIICFFVFLMLIITMRVVLI